MRGQPGRIQINVELATRATRYVCRGQPRNALDTCLDVVFNPVRFFEYIATHGITGKGLDGIEREGVLRKRICGYSRFIHVLRVVWHLRQRVRGPNKGIADVGAERKLQFYGALAKTGGGIETLESRYVAQKFFLLDQDFLLNVLGTGARPARIHTDDAWIEVGNELDGHPE